MSGQHGDCEEEGSFVFASQFRADQMPGPPRKGQLMCILFLSTRVNEASNTSDPILPHEENHGITLRRPQVPQPITQVLQIRKKAKGARAPLGATAAAAPSQRSVPN